jgi:hypothetical protein
MKVLPKPKQVRFAQLLKSSGNPHAATLWTEPDRDPEFKKAMDDNRIVTVRNVNVGTKKDRGVIGFLKGPNSTYLVFPKPLPMAEGTGVIGLKFEELADAPVRDPVKVKTAPRKTKLEKVKTVQEPNPKPRSKITPPKSRPTKATEKPKEQKKELTEKTSRFRVKVAFSATVLREIEVEAAGASAAIEAAEQKAHQDPPSDIQWKVEGLEVKKLK